MKFSFYKRDLQDALKLVSRSVAVKPMTPILSGIYLCAQGNQLELQSTDLNTGTIARIPISCERDGQTVVSGGKFKEIIDKMPDDTVTAELDGTQLSLESGAARFELLTHTPDDFPQVKRPEGQTIQLKASLLKEIITKVAYAVAKDDVRPAFKAVYLEIGGGEIKAASTNGHRLAHFKAAMPTDDEVKALIPATALRNLTLVLPDNETPVEMILGGRQVAFEFNNFLVTARQIEGEFPPVEKLLQPQKGFNARIPRLELKQVLNRVGIVAKDNEYNTIIMNVEPNCLTVSSRTESSTGQECMEIEGGEDLTIGFNSAYWLEYLTSTQGEKLTVYFGNEFEPVLIVDEDDARYLAVITPVRT